jgi:hypothetical protein
MQNRIELSSGAINFIYRNVSGTDQTKISIDASGNASFSGAVTASSGTIGGFALTSNWLYTGSQADPTLVINATESSIYIRPQLTNLKFVMFGQTYRGASSGATPTWSGRYGISAIDSANRWVFVLDDEIKQIAGFNFNESKISIGNSSQGFAFNTSSTRWIANSGNGFEVWNPSDTRLFCGTLDSSGNLSKGFAWNLNDTSTYDLKLVVAGDVISSRFSTTTTYEHTATFSGVVVTSWGMTAKYFDGTNSYSGQLTPRQLACQAPGGGSIYISWETGYRTIQIDGQNVPKFWGI